ncbi:MULTISPECIES: RibD family protein [unclassified Coleofasciculus]|uniref:RibD family protein n=1 Tax=unclassified Coleofasciculus TaxID=2692782 RepID=UPI0018825802|nr:MULTISPECIES: RibD family protein [unclassified Coleofasciculus]MBE9129234.1 RibD family protein [Coleofasciculus sp. LEGE 07081]MBE9148249.1 RibD family protein [Coleofasciculus sp. LEGE 07092]
MLENYAINRPHMTVILAMSADGKIADVTRSPARFSSPTDRAHLEKQVALADGVLFGAGTLRAYGTTLGVSNPQLLKLRQQRGVPTQPVQIVCSRLAQLDPKWRFFRQQVPRWLLTTRAGAEGWRHSSASADGGFDQILVAGTSGGGIDWEQACQQLTGLGIRRLAVLGGGELVASLLAANLIDEFWLTVCPLILGGSTAPTPVEGEGFLGELAKPLELVEIENIGQEIFLHYRRQAYFLGCRK